jgi:hypothetical protein
MPLVLAGEKYVKFDSQALNKITLMSILYGVNAKVPNHTWSGQGFCFQIRSY